MLPSKIISNLSNEVNKKEMQQDSISIKDFGIELLKNEKVKAKFDALTEGKSDEEITKIAQDFYSEFQKLAEAGEKGVSAKEYDEIFNSMTEKFSVLIPEKAQNLSSISEEELQEVAANLESIKTSSQEVDFSDDKLPNATPENRRSNQPTKTK